MTIKSQFTVCACLDQKISYFCCGLRSESHVISLNKRKKEKDSSSALIGLYWQGVMSVFYMFLHSLWYIKNQLLILLLEYLYGSVHCSFSVVADWPEGAALTLGFGRSALNLLCARYCMQGHHLAAASSGQAASELSASLCFKEYNNRSHPCMLPQQIQTQQEQ